MLCNIMEVEHDLIPTSHASSNFRYTQIYNVKCHTFQLRKALRKLHEKLDELIVCHIEQSECQNFQVWHVHPLHILQNGFKLHQLEQHQFLQALYLVYF